jgi:hypothetical protein
MSLRILPHRADVHFFGFCFHPDALGYSALSACSILISNGEKPAVVVVGTLLADGLGLVVAGDVQPLIDTRTSAPMQSNGTA